MNMASPTASKQGDEIVQAERPIARKRVLALLHKSPTAGGLLGSATLRFATLPISGLASLLLARLVNETYGISTYGYFALISTLPALLPSLDFGLGAAITNRAASVREYPHDFMLTYRAALHRLWILAGVITLASITICFFRSWPMLIGVPDRMDLNIPACLAVCVLALSLPGGVAGASLIGFGRNQLLILLQTITPISGLAFIYVSVSVGATDLVVISCSTAGLFISSWTTYLVVRKSPQMRTARSESMRPHASTRRSRRNREFRTATPMLVIMIMGPFTFQTGRIMLSWLSGALAVGQFSAAMAVFNPVFSTAQVAGRSLWSQFARMRVSDQNPSTTFRSAIKVCAAIGIVGGLSVAVIGPIISKWATANQAEIPTELFWVFGGIVFVTALHQPGGMFLTDASGLRFQAITSCVMAVIAVTVSLSLISFVGLLAPAIGTLSGLLLGQFLPCLVESTRRIKVFDLRK